MSTNKALSYLRAEMEKKEKRTVMIFDEFLGLTVSVPKKVLRNIFQLFHDMVRTYVISGKDEYPDDPESIGFVNHDCKKIFVEGANNAFFADRLFANRFVRQAESFRRGSQQNKVYVYEGPHGCGKSTFMNNLLRTFELYTDTKEGQCFEIYWDVAGKSSSESVEFQCPSHDHPILLIPKNYRREFLRELLMENPENSEFIGSLFRDKEYSWVFDSEVCTICKSMFDALLEKHDGATEKVLNSVRVRTYKFDRRLGEGISVFNPGDRLPEKESFLTDKELQSQLDKIFGINAVRYIYSRLARTNNGVYVLMDIKQHNLNRLLELHNVISDGVHKVVDIEEKINSLFLALMNPEDKKPIMMNPEDKKSDDKKFASNSEEKRPIEEVSNSFQGRMQIDKIRYVLEVPTEVKIYKKTFGEEIEGRFLPRVLENFARVVISSRMNQECAPLKEWIPGISKYSRYCDDAGLLLRMEIYGGVIPGWLSDEDKKKFTVQVRRKLIAEGENEGNTGLNGRDSIKLFNELYSRYGPRPNLINMGNITDFFKHRMGRDERDKHIPKNFIASMVNWYDYVVLGEVKESLYFYNKDKIVENILHYLFSVNYDPGSKVRCKYTGKDVEVTVENLKLMSLFFTGRSSMGDGETIKYAKENQQKYAELIAQEPNGDIKQSELFLELLSSYEKNLKEKALQPFIKNESFREAVKSFGTPEFNTFDTRLREHVEHMVGKLKNFGYTEQGAKEICLYVIDQKLADKF